MIALPANTLDQWEASPGSGGGMLTNERRAAELQL